MNTFNYLRNILFVFIVFIGCFSAQLYAMEPEEQEKSSIPIIISSHQDEDQQPVDTSQKIILTFPEELPPDMWVSIVEQCDDISSLGRLSSTSKTFYVVINQLKPHLLQLMLEKACSDLEKLQDRSRGKLFFADAIDKGVKKAASIAKTIDTVKSRLEGIKRHLPANTLQPVNELLAVGDEGLKDASLYLLDQSTEAPSWLSCCIQSKDEEYLLIRQGYPLRKKAYSCFKLLTRNLKINAAITVLAFGGIVLIGCEVFPAPPPLALMNINNFTADSDFGHCNSGCHEAVLPWGGWWNGGTYTYGQPDPRFPCDMPNEKWIPTGNLMDFITYACHQCGCNATHWYQIASSRLNGTTYNPNLALCFPNIDNISSCCGQIITKAQCAYDQINGYGWAEVCVNMVRITKACARNQAIRNMGLYYGFGIPLAFSLIWLMLIDYFYCSG